MTDLPTRALETSAEHPWPVRHLSAKIAEYVHRMPGAPVAGQLVQVNRRAGMSFMTLRDTDADVSLSLVAHTRVLGDLGEGAHVVVRATPTFWPKRGTLQLQADAIRVVGLGELLARIEHLRSVLAAEGLFAADRKVALPFLPLVVGLVCGRESKAEHDVVVNARARWPQVEFVIREVAVQGPRAVPEVCAAIAALDDDPSVEVIVVARGGGSVEDLLPFSNETLVRAAAACRTPLVSAIGHETDTPLLDLVADYRASTPTDAAKRVVPDVGEERLRLTQAGMRATAAVERLVRRELDRLAQLRSRPALAAPSSLLDRHGETVERLRDQVRRSLTTVIAAEAPPLARLAAQVPALSPAATLARGYAVVQRPDGRVVRDPAEVAVGDLLRLRLAGGQVPVRAVEPDDAG
ncbi:MAG TPA: exodeoxyribonuclease VII large subunit [Actinotalea sp.]|nr:exodeoxyribonuclease VII large subunit [Actinotalea sp.]